MDRVVKLVAYPPKLEKAKRVAAYARVSCGKDAMLNSLSQQVSYYSDFIQKHVGWEYSEHEGIISRDDFIAVQHI